MENLENLDREINKLIRDKVDFLLGGNHYKRRRMHIDFAKNNKINTFDRIEAIYAAFDQLLRDILKASVTLEKTARITNKVPMSEDRRTELKILLTDEVEGILIQMEKECRTNYAKQGKAEEFERKWEESRSTIKSKIEKLTQKAKDDIEKKIAP